MSWMDPHPNNDDAFADAFWDDLDAEDDAAHRLADRLDDFRPFIAPSPQSPRGEARPLTTAERGPDADNASPAATSGPPPSSRCAA